MAEYKVTFFFEGMQTGPVGVGSALGWTESFYLIAGNANIDVILNNPVPEDDDVQRYIDIRRRILPDIYRMTFVRVERLAPDVPAVKIKGLVNAFGQITSDVSEPAQVQCAMLVDLYALPGAGAGRAIRRPFLLRGLPRDVMLGNVIRGAGPVSLGIKRYLDFIASKPTGDIHPPGAPVAKNLGVRYLNGTLLPVVVDKIKVNPNDQRTILVAPDFPAAPINSKFFIRGVTDEPRMNRQWRLLDRVVIGPVTYMMLGKTRGDLVSNYEYTGPGSARIRLFGPLYSLFHQYTIIGMRNKKTGKISRQLVGKSSRG